MAVTKLRNFYKKWTYQRVLTAAVDPSAAAIVAGRTGYTIMVTQIHFNVTTSAAQTLAVRDDSAGPVNVHIFAANTAVGGHDISFEDDGFACTESTNLDLAASAAGYAGTLYIEGYWKPTAVLTQAQV